MRRQKTVELLRFCNSYGVVNGTKMYVSANYRNREKLLVPGIKDPIYLRKKTSDYAVFCQLFLYNQYNFNVGFEVHTIIDAGANIGLASVQFKNKYPKATIIAIEPDAANFSQLQKNTAGYSDVHLKQAALWNKETHLSLTDKYKCGEWAFVTEEISSPSTTDIRAVSVSSIFKEYGISQLDILKIDIETAEREVFAKNYEDWLPNVKVIMIELHDKLKKGTAMAFFRAVTHSLRNFSYYQVGETSIIINDGLVNS